MVVAPLRGAEGHGRERFFLRVHQSQPARIQMDRKKARCFDETSYWDKAELGWIYNKDKQSGKRSTFLGEN